MVTIGFSYKTVSCCLEKEFQNALIPLGDVDDVARVFFGPVEDGLVLVHLLYPKAYGGVGLLFDERQHPPLLFRTAHPKALSHLLGPCYPVAEGAHSLHGFTCLCPGADGPS